jgi:AraC-like DNA-binding protein
MKNDYLNAVYENIWDTRSLPCAWFMDYSVFPAHFHSSFEFTYQIKGETHVILDGQPYVLKPGEMLLVSGSIVHAGTSSPGSDSYVMIIPLPAVPYLQSALSGKVFKRPIMEKCSVTKDAVDCMKKVIPYLDMLDRPDSYSPYKTYISSALLKGYAYTFFSLLIKEVGLCDLQSSKTSLLAQDILNYLQANYLEPITLDTLCNEFGYSRSRFSHIFNNYFGCSLTKYLNILRCLHFNDIFNDQSDLDIADAALDCGFGSVRSFYRAYRDLYGHSPRQDDSSYSSV